MSSGEEASESSQDSNVFGKFAVASVLLMVYMLVQRNLGMSAVFFTLATFLYALDIRRRPGRLSLV
ncbi:MAG: hypothetical protein ABIJ47_08035 [Candidatus Bathyarchaeota archaeon]